MFIIGVENLVVEVEAKYIKGMINNPDIQLSATINRWIAGILLFDFKLRHVSAKDHTPADRLLRRPRSQDDPMDDANTDKLIDHAYSFGVECLNRQLMMPSSPLDRNDVSQIKVAKLHFREKFLSKMIASLTINIMEIPRSAKVRKFKEKITKVREFLNNPNDFWIF